MGIFWYWDVLLIPHKLFPMYFLHCLSKYESWSIWQSFIVWRWRFEKCLWKLRREELSRTFYLLLYCQKRRGGAGCRHKFSLLSSRLGFNCPEKSPNQTPQIWTLKSKAKCPSSASQTNISSFSPSVFCHLSHSRSSNVSSLCHSLASRVFLEKSDGGILWLICQLSWFASLTHPEHWKSSWLGNFKSLLVPYFVKLCFNKGKVICSCPENT